MYTHVHIHTHQLTSHRSDANASPPAKPKDPTRGHASLATAFRLACKPTTATLQSGQPV